MQDEILVVKRVSHKAVTRPLTQGYAKLLPFQGGIFTSGGNAGERQIKFVAIVISNTGTALFYMMGSDMGLEWH